MRLSIAAAPLIAASTLLMARAAPVDYTVHAVRFAHVPYAARNLVAGVTDRTRMVDIAFTVWVVQGGRALARGVGLGARASDGAQVTAGLSRGDTVVLYPPDAIANGARIRPGAPPR